MELEDRSQVANAIFVGVRFLETIASLQQVFPSMMFCKIEEDCDGDFERYEQGFNSMKKFEVVSSSKVEDIFILETSVYKKWLQNLCAICFGMLNFGDSCVVLEILGRKEVNERNE